MMKKYLKLLLCASFLMMAFFLPTSLAYGAESIVITSQAEYDAITWSSNLSKTIIIQCDLTINARISTSESSPFTGLLIGKLGGVDGAKPTITLNISLGSRPVGWVGALGEGGLVDNFIIKGSVTGTGSVYNVGSAVGVVVGNNATVRNIINYAAITSAQRGGGIIGSMNAVSNLTISNCENYGRVASTTNQAMGGILGYTLAGSSNVTIENCFNQGEIAATALGGGIVGTFNGSNNRILKSANLGSVTVTGNSAGGILGSLSGSATVEIDQCYNEGTIQAANYAGGIIGNGTVDCSQAVTNSYNKGAIQVITNYGGGISYSLGTQTSTKNFKMEFCYNTGDVTGPSDSQIYSLAAHVRGGTASAQYNCYTPSSTAMAITRVNGVEITNQSFEEYDREYLGGLSFSSDLWSALANNSPVLRNNLPRINTGTAGTPRYEKEAYHTVFINWEENGSINKDNTIFVKDQESLTFTVLPQIGYAIKVLTFDGSEIQIPGQTVYKTPAITTNAVILATFKERVYTTDLSNGVAYVTALTNEDIDPLTNISSEEKEQIKNSVAGIVFATISNFNPSDLTDFGILISKENLTEDEFILDGNSVSKASAISLIENFEGSYGILFYGNLLTHDSVYYIRPYVNVNGTIKYAQISSFTAKKVQILKD